MDLDRLHHDWLEEQGGTGQTYRMLVEAIHHADFDVGPILIKVATNAEISRMMNMIVSIAADMGYRTRLLRQGRIMVNDIEIIFSVGMGDPVGLRPAEVYTDHYVFERRWE